MPAPPPVPSRSGRETRLLLVTIAVSVGVLLLLARFRFPEAPRAAATATQPLERLAARATYDELAAIIEQLESRVAPSALVLRISASRSASPSIDAGSEQPRFVPGLRIRDDLVLAALHPEDRVQGIVGNAEAVPMMLAADRVRGLALVRVPAQPTQLPVAESPRVTTSPRYVAALEGTRGGPSLRPLFLGRTDPVVGPRWDRPLLALGGTPQAQIGSIVFTFDGRLAGMVVADEGVPLLAPGDALLQAADALLQGRTAQTGDLGVTFQPLTPDLARVTGASRGAVVAHIDPDGPSAGILRLGDVIETVANEAVFSADALDLRIARAQPGQRLPVKARRGSDAIDAILTVRAYEPAAPAPLVGQLGLTLAAVQDLGSEVARVEPRSLGAHAGLMAGDIITRFGDIDAPTPADITRTFARSATGTTWLVGAARRDRHFVIVLEKP
ncbi:MAG: PDZ domain-containing protein [Acidobacteria bacterium]|nr:PDZ domain-containing protein [Acidobacteriota bacterium]